MPIPILSNKEIKKMRSAGHMAAKVLKFIQKYVQPGVSTLSLDTLCHNFIKDNKCIPAPLNYRGFPKSICTSINNIVCHGIPSEKDILQEGDIINIDITVIKDGYHGDTSRTFFVGNVNQKAKLLVKRTEEAMNRGISVVKPGAVINDIGKAIEKYISKFPYGIVRDFTGHGIGKKFHDDPTVLHYDTGTPGPKMREGMAFTIEPMINASTQWKVQVDPHDKWTVRTIDHSLSAQFEHTLLVTSSGHEILTL
jgi:methionyl aminopeptidase